MAKGQLWQSVKSFWAQSRASAGSRGKLLMLCNGNWLGHGQLGMLESHGVPHGRARHRRAAMVLHSEMLCRPPVWEQRAHTHGWSTVLRDKPGITGRTPGTRAALGEGQLHVTVWDTLQEWQHWARALWSQQGTATYGRPRVASRPWRHRHCHRLLHEWLCRGPTAFLQSFIYGW